MQEVSAIEFLQALHPSPDDVVCLRAFYDPDKRAAKNFTVKMSELPGLLPELQRLNDQRWGIFHIVNSGGHSDADITHITAQFFEADSSTIEEQLAAIADFSLRPSIVVRTRKSLHVYFKTVDANVSRFRDIQKQLVARFNGDPVCVNESRVMRVPGFFHHKKEPVLVECLEFHPELVYCQNDISSCLPAIMETARNTTASAAVSGDNRGLEIACSKCLFLQHCQAHPEELSEHDWYAMLTNLAPFKGGRDKAHEYSKPYPGYSERETDTKIEHFLASETAPIWCNTIAEKGWMCSNLGGTCGCNSPSGLAYQKLTIPELDAFLSLLVKNTEPGGGLQNYVAAKEFIEEYFLNVTFDVGDVFICEKMANHLGLKQKDCKTLVKMFKDSVKQQNISTGDLDYGIPIGELLSMVRARYEDADRRTAAVCVHIYNWLEHNGAVFFRYGDSTCSVQFGNKLFQIGNTRNFTAFVYDNTGIVPSSLEGRAVIQTIGDRAYTEGHRVKQAKWLMYDLRDAKLYVNLCNDDSQILRISAGEVATIPNGINTDKVILADTTTKMTPIGYKPKEDMAAGLRLFKKHVIDNLTCRPTNRLMIACIVIAMFLKDVAASKPILKFSGSTSTGKSTAAKLISTLIYGHDTLQAPTTAALYSAASQDPLCILDNLETEDMTKEGKQFLLTGATGITKIKRDMGTNTGIVEESVDALIIVTAIEAFAKSELINRTYDFAFSGQYKQKGFLERDAMREVITHRDEMLSGIINLIAYEVMPQLGFLRKDAIEILDQNPHSKDRTNDFLSIVMAVLIKLIAVVPEFAPEGAPVNKIVESWLNYHNAMAAATEAETDPTLFLMEMLLKALRLEDGIKKSEMFDLRLIKENNIIVGWECVMKELFSAFAQLAKRQGYRFEYQTAHQLQSRIASNRTLFDGNGWAVTKGKLWGGYPSYTFMKGD